MDLTTTTWVRTTTTLPHGVLTDRVSTGGSVWWVLVAAVFVLVLVGAGIRTLTRVTRLGGPGR